jgi:hypothetical protein
MKNNLKGQLTEYHFSTINSVHATKKPHFHLPFGQLCWSFSSYLLNGKKQEFYGGHMTLVYLRRLLEMVYI